MLEVPASSGTGYPALLGGRRNPAEDTASEVDSNNRAALVAGEEATLPLQTAFGENVLVSVVGQQADGSRRVVRGHFALRRSPDLWFDPDSKRHPRVVGGDDERHGVVLVPADELPGLRRVIGQ